jgi:OmcA/MtrC family decaheme c-type cytochrome
VTDKAHNLTATDGIWVRPGLNFTLNGLTIGSDLRPVVTLRLTDDGGQGLDRTGKLTPGTVSMSFIMAYIPQSSSQYVAYTTRTQKSPITGVTAIQAGTDSGGTWTDLGDGNYTYTFKTALPSSYDQTATHTLGVYGSRNLAEFGLSRYRVNFTKNFVPNGSTPTKIREVAVTASCNQCHDPLMAHGETGREAVEICILCHTPQTIDPDTGNTVDMKVMTHKIHMGDQLPSVIAGTPYKIIGNAQSVNDYSTVAFPMDIRNCQVCHKDSAQVNNWLLNPTRATCGSCHDDIDWVKGTNHKAGAQADDAKCAECHKPQGEFEYDASISGAHIPPYKSSQLLYPVVKITGVTNTAPGQAPSVSFTIADKNGKPINPATLTGSAGRLAVTIGGPTTDYNWYLQETADKAAYADGVATYTFKGVIPAAAKGTYAAEVEGRIVTALNPGPGGKPGTYQESWPTAVQFFTVTDEKVTPRHTVVDLAKCNKCHDKLQLHGSNRNTIESCVMCHNPTNTDVARRTAATLPAQSIDMKLMIHRIHTGEELAYDYTIYGFGNSKNTFNEVRYPGDRRDCQQCHVTTNYTVPLPDVVQPTKMPRGFWDPYQPTSAACLGCHDSLEAAAHAYINTSPLGEACVVCHEEGADFAVTEEHSR